MRLDDATLLLPDTAVSDRARSRTAARPRAAFRAWFALAVLMLPTVLVSIDSTVLSFALPDIAGDLGPSAAEQLWIIDAYPLVLAGLLVAMGSIGDRVGRRRLLVIGSIGFTLVSVAAAFVTTAEALIAARAALGFFGAMLMPSTLSLLRSVFDDREQRRLAIAIWATGFAAGSALGPIVGGALLEQFGWASVFLLAVPVLVPLLVLLPVLVPESRDPAPGPLDVVSIVLSLATMVPVVYGIKSIATEGLSLPGLGAVAVGAAFAIWFVRRQLLARQPMLDVRLFRRGSFGGAVLVNLLSVIGLVGFLFFASQRLQLVVGLSPVEAGWVLTPGLAAMIVAGVVVVPIAKRVAGRVVVPVSLVLAAAGYVIVALTATSTSIAPMVIAFALLGIGIGAAQTVANELALSSAPAEKAGAASAVSETAYDLGAVLGTAIMGSILALHYRASLAVPADLTGEQADTSLETLAGAFETADDLPAATAAALEASAAQAFDGGVVITSLIGVALLGAAALIAAMTLGRSSTSHA